eukprot:85516_1
MSFRSNDDIFDGWKALNLECKKCNSAMIYTYCLWFDTKCKNCQQIINKYEYMYYCSNNKRHRKVFGFCLKCSNHMISALKVARAIIFGTVSKIIPKEYIVYAVDKDLTLLISGYFHSSTQYSIPDAIKMIVYNQCKVHYSEFTNVVCRFSYCHTSNGWDDEDTWSSNHYVNSVIQMNGKCIYYNSNMEREIGPYGKEKSDSNSSGSEGFIQTHDMDRLLSWLEKLPIRYRLKGENSCVNTGISFNKFSSTWSFDNLYQSRILRNRNYESWNQENIQLLKTLMSVLEEKYKMNFKGVDVNKINQSFLSAFLGLCINNH